MHPRHHRRRVHFIGTKLYLKLVVTHPWSVMSMMFLCSHHLDGGWYILTAQGDLVPEAQTIDIQAHSIVIMSQPFNFSWSGQSTSFRSRRKIGHALLRINHEEHTTQYWKTTYSFVGKKRRELCVKYPCAQLQKYMRQHSLPSPRSFEYPPSENVESAFHGHVI